MKTARILILLLAALAAGAAGAQDKGPGFGDALITERVVRALDGDALLRDLRISVETRNGVVYLHGFVDSIGQLERAVALARGVDGVSGVRNTIRVIDRPSRA